MSFHPDSGLRGGPDILDRAPLEPGKLGDAGSSEMREARRCREPRRVGKLGEFPVISAGLRPQLPVGRDSSQTGPRSETIAFDGRNDAGVPQRGWDDLTT